jgi:PEP-CTERM motif
MTSQLNGLLFSATATRSLGRLVSRLCVSMTIMVIASAFTARADIVYTLNDTVGAGAVTGTITTDGFLGTLATADIIDWNLVLTNGFGTTLNLTGPSATAPIEGAEVLGSSLTASSTNLSFDFDGAGHFLIQQNGLDNGGTYFCDGGSGQAACIAGGESDFPGVAFAPNQQFAARSGDISIGTAASLGSTVPEPSSVFLLSAALLGVSLLARRRLGGDNGWALEQRIGDLRRIFDRSGIGKTSV